MATPISGRAPRREVLERTSSPDDNDEDDAWSLESILDGGGDSDSDLCCRIEDGSSFSPSYNINMNMHDDEGASFLLRPSIPITRRRRRKSSSAVKKEKEVAAAAAEASASSRQPCQPTGESSREEAELSLRRLAANLACSSVASSTANCSSTRNEHIHGPAADDKEDEEGWACPWCTFVNAQSSKLCDVCAYRHFGDKGFTDMDFHVGEHFNESGGRLDGLDGKDSDSEDDIGEGDKWSCPRCTLLNPKTCAVCALCEYNMNHFRSTDDQRRDDDCVTSSHNGGTIVDNVVDGNAESTEKDGPGYSNRKRLVAPYADGRGELNATLSSVAERCGDTDASSDPSDVPARTVKVSTRDQRHSSLPRTTMPSTSPPTACTAHNAISAAASRRRSSLRGDSDSFPPARKNHNGTGTWSMAMAKTTFGRFHDNDNTHEKSVRPGHGQRSVMRRYRPWAVGDSRDDIMPDDDLSVAPSLGWDHVVRRPPGWDAAGWSVAATGNVSTVKGAAAEWTPTNEGMGWSASTTADRKRRNRARCSLTTVRTKNLAPPLLAELTEEEEEEEETTRPKEFTGRKSMLPPEHEEEQQGVGEIGKTQATTADTVTTPTMADIAAGAAAVARERMMACANANATSNSNSNAHSVAEGSAAPVLDTAAAESVNGIEAGGPTFAVGRGTDRADVRVVAAKPVGPAHVVSMSNMATIAAEAAAIGRARMRNCADVESKIPASKLRSRSKSGHPGSLNNANPAHTKSFPGAAVLSPEAAERARAQNTMTAAAFEAAAIARQWNEAMGWRS